MLPDPERLWCVPDAAAFLNVSRSWVRLHVRLGDLPHVRIGGLLRFWPEQIRSYARGEAVPRTVVPLRPRGA